MSKALDDLDPKFLPKALNFLRNLKASDVPYVQGETRRTVDEQKEKYRLGYSKCDGIKILSPHQKGLAIDIYAVDDRGTPTWNYVKYADEYKRIAACARGAGLECGIDWFPSPYGDKIGWDPDHFQEPGA